MRAGKSKHILRLSLVITSVVLLVVLQGFWVVSSYENAQIAFRRDASSIFRSTVYSIRDSLFQRNVIYVKNDKLRDSLVLRHGPVRVNVGSPDLHVPGDSSVVHSRLLHSQGFHQAIIDRSIGNHDDTTHQIIIMTTDSAMVTVDEVKSKFRAALAGNGIDSIVQIRVFRTPPEDLPRALRPSFRSNEMSGPHQRSRLFRDTIATEPVRMDPAHVYAALLPNSRVHLLKEITPQIAFSIILTSIVVISFTSMYRSTRKQEQLLEMKNHFIGNVTHELKTPIATVSVAIEAMKNFDVLKHRERTIEYLSIAQNELNRLSLMTDKILKTAAFESQGITIVPERISLPNIISMVLDSLKLVIDRKSIIVSCDIPEEGGVVEGSEEHLINVVYNLIDNAIKYSNPEGAIDISIADDNLLCMLTIRDNGIGIPPEYQSRIFDKFFRVPTGDVHNTKGYGLGLNYVREVVIAHNGSISVVSVPKNGSTFKISLPKKYVSHESSLR